MSTPPGDQNQFSEKPLPSATPTGRSTDGQAAPMGAELFNYVLDCLDQGSSKAQVRKHLIAMGYSSTEAEETVEEVAEWRQNNPDAQTSRPYPDAPNIANTNIAVGGGGGVGNTSMWIGGLICLFGIVVTVGSCLASGERGGSVVVAWGAIIFGGIQFFRGLSQSNES